ncbi:MAG: hypothetical protein J1F35_02730 [Erysipelotrichales bacterium]|nr:hypothetical protein [Erysipelotrichales bacterium]
MGDFEESVFIKRLKDGIETTLMLMCHNAYWYQLERYKKISSNYKLAVFGSGTYYVRMRKNDIPLDCDFIILDSSEEYREAEYLEVKRFAKELSSGSNKRVTSGYIYFIPKDERENFDVSHKFVIASYKNDIESEKVIPITSGYDMLDLADLLVAEHNKLENQKILHKQ